ncbi:MAG TPA: FtsX-like permease family protein, partial [Chitinophagaceae bacterium]
NYGQIWVKLSPENIPHTLTILEATFKRLVPLFPYSYQFMEDAITKNYESESKWKQIINIASGLFIFIACIGLLGLVMLSIQQRTKELGIRKVLGAAAFRIVTLVSREFIILIVISFLVAVPVGYYFASKWLQNFPYRAGLKWWMFGLSGVIVFSLAVLTIFLRTIKAATDNPIKSLRTE